MWSFFKKKLSSDHGLTEETTDLLAQDVTELKEPKQVRAYLRDLTLKKLEIKQADFLSDVLQSKLLIMIDDKFDEVNLLCPDEALAWSTSRAVMSGGKK